MAPAEHSVLLPWFAGLKVAHDCGVQPLALSMVGYLAKDQPLDPASWRTVHEKLRGTHFKFRKLDQARLFSAIDTSFLGLPSNQQEQLQLMAVMASGVAATSEMLASLWNQVWKPLTSANVRVFLVAD